MNSNRNNQRGSARLKFLIVMIVIGGLAYAGYVYVPVAYQSYMYKDLMQHYVDVAAAQGYQPTWILDQLKKSSREYEVPENAIITPVLKDNRLECRVQFTRPLEFPGYVYSYEFDYTAKSTAFLTFK